MSRGSWERRPTVTRIAMVDQSRLSKMLISCMKLVERGDGDVDLVRKTNAANYSRTPFTPQTLNAFLRAAYDSGRGPPEWRAWFERKKAGDVVGAAVAAVSATQAPKSTEDWASLVEALREQIREQSMARHDAEQASDALQEAFAARVQEDVDAIVRRKFESVETRVLDETRTLRNELNAEKTKRKEAEYECSKMSERLGEMEAHVASVNARQSNINSVAEDNESRIASLQANVCRLETKNRESDAALRDEKLAKETLAAKLRMQEGRGQVGRVPERRDAHSPNVSTALAELVKGGVMTIDEALERAAMAAT